MPSSSYEVDLNKQKGGDKGWASRPNSGEFVSRMSSIQPGPHVKPFNPCKQDFHCSDSHSLEAIVGEPESRISLPHTITQKVLEGKDGGWSGFTKEGTTPQSFSQGKTQGGSNHTIEKAV
jgi:hypothetical protein